MAKNDFLEDLQLPDDDVAMDADDLLDENGELNLDAVAPQSGAPSKVDLDLDDAPFLQEESEEEEPHAEPAGEEAPLSLEQAVDSEPTGLKKLLKNKKVLAGGGGGLLLLLGLLLFLLLGGEDKPQSPPPPSYASEEPEVELPPIEAKPGEVLIEWEPFWIEYTDESSGEIRFLVCELSAPTTDPALKAEAEAKILTIRDAIYYYLAHKPLMFLSNQQNAETMKEDLVGIVNGYLTHGQLSQIYIENYLIK
ncbi:MAG: flagellar basal body-associated FliL family protein [Desulfovibrionaceae bacterium]|nr:flagellar basal body-associated FliL family protein [Desulfovibrionaceae bacterium]